jgi:hypothetical protein
MYPSWLVLLRAWAVAVVHAAMQVCIYFFGLFWVLSNGYMLTEPITKCCKE